GPVARRVIAGGMRGGSVGDLLDECRATALAGTPRGPLRDRVHGEEIVAVDADAGNPVTGTALREGASLPAGEALEGGDRPLVVDYVQDHRRLINGGEGHRVVKVCLGARAL